MPRMVLGIIFLGIAMGSCGGAVNHSKSDIVKIIDFELSPDESKIAFSAITPVGNLDIWVVDIDGKNLKKLTFQDRSLINRTAKFFKKYRWRNFFEIDMRYPEWTNEGRIVFCQQLSKSDAWSVRTVSRRYWTINPNNGADKKLQLDSDKIIRKRQPTLINKFKFSERSEKYKITILLKNDFLWTLKDEETSLERLIQ